MKTAIPCEAIKTPQGWVLYDGECPLCINVAARFDGLLHRHHFKLAPLQTPWAQQRLGLKAGDPLAEMKFLADDGRIFGGVDALVQIARRIWWAWPLFALAQIPGVKILLRVFYQQIAARRNCVGGSCGVEQPQQFFVLDWIPLFALPLVAWFLTFRGAAWITCWALVLAIVFGFKWPIWRRTERRIGKGNYISCVAFFLWPDMDAKAFLAKKQKLRPIGPLIWVAAILEIIFGAVLIWIGAGFFVANEPLLAGWIGMIGLVFLLHFGLFNLSGLIYRRAGIVVEPIMRAPILSQSLGEFWGRRWNLAFNKLAYDFGFAPLRRRFGIVGATLATFAASGAIHELVISIPARGGYGLPTGYFLIQGLGVVTEHTKFARRIGLGRGFRGWLFTLFVTVGPAFWLFHPPFVRNIILPMLHALGAT